MDSRCVAYLKYFPNHLETDIQINACAYEDVVNLRLGKHRPVIFDTSAVKKLDIWHTQLLLHVVEEDF
jgi:hypothetical protein